MLFLKLIYHTKPSKCLITTIINKQKCINTILIRVMIQWFDRLFCFRIMWNTRFTLELLILFFGYQNFICCVTICSKYHTSFNVRQLAILLKMRYLFAASFLSGKHIIIFIYSNFLIKLHHFFRETSNWFGNTSLWLNINYL